MTIEEIRQLVDLCLEKKISHLSINGVIIGMSPQAFAPVPEPVIMGKLPIPDPDLEMPKDKDLLDWSSPIEQIEVSPRN